MADVLMTLGSFSFSVDTAAYEELVRTNEWRWPSQARTGQRPALQYTGPGVETIEIEGKVLPHYKGGLDQIKALRALGDEGAPQMLTDGLGKVWGKFAIHHLEERQTHIVERGVPLLQAFSLSLAHTGEEAQSS